MAEAGTAGFAEVLQSLQVLHDKHILKLQSENIELQNELRILKEHMVSAAKQEEQDNVPVLKDASVQASESRHDAQNSFPSAPRSKQPDKAASRPSKTVAPAPTRLQKFIESTMFEITMSVVIGLNAIQVGVEAHISRTGHSHPNFLKVSDIVFYVIYIVELTLRLAGRGPLRGLKSPGSNLTWLSFVVAL